MFFLNTHFYYGRMTRDYSRVNLWQDFLLYIVRWMPWAVCAPALIWLARRFPLRGRRWPVHLAILIPGCLAVSTLESIVSFGLYNLVFEPIVKLADANIYYLENLELTVLTYLNSNVIMAFTIPVVV